VNKTIEMWLQGYFLFKVNGKYFVKYSSALSEKNKARDSFSFSGFRLFKGWKEFYWQLSLKDFELQMTNFVDGYPGERTKTK
jgi:hypothetical protein